MYEMGPETCDFYRILSIQIVDARQRKAPLRGAGSRDRLPPSRKSQAQMLE